MLTRLIQLALLLLLPSLSAQIPAQEQDAQALVELGELTFADNCRKCHQLDGYGEESLYPSLHQPALLADRALLVQTILHGRVNTQPPSGDEAERLMPALDFLSDREIAALVAYISYRWGDDTVIVTEAEVAALRQTPPR
jgi:mono/diheme cytochrome c family protein